MLFLVVFVIIGKGCECIADNGFIAVVEGAINLQDFTFLFADFVVYAIVR